MIDLFKRKWERINYKWNYYDDRLWYLVAIRVINALGFSVVLPFISIYLYSEQGVPMTIVGSLFLGAAIIRAATQIIGGGLSDKLGRRKIMLFASVGRTLSFVLLATAIYFQLSVYFIGLFIILSYGFGAMFMPAADALISDLVLPKDRVEAYSYQRIGLNLGWAIGPAMGGYLASLSFYFLFLIAAFFFFIVVFIVYFFIADSNNEESRSQFNIQSLKELSRNRSFLLFGFLCFLAFSILTQFISTLSVYSIEIVHISKIQIGYLFSLNGLIIILFQFPGIKWINRMTLTRALSLGAALAGVSYLIVAFSHNFLMLAISIVVLTFGEIFFIPSGTALTSNWAPESEKGTYLGMYGLFQGMGRSFGPFYGGILLDHYLNHPFILWGTLAAIGLITAAGLSQIKRFISPEINQETAP